MPPHGHWGISASGMSGELTNMKASSCVCIPVETPFDTMNTHYVITVDRRMISVDESGAGMTGETVGNAAGNTRVR